MITTFTLFLLFIISSVIIGCPNGSIEWQKNCYFFESNQTAAFIVAEESCQKLGGHLTSVHDAFANQFLAQNAALQFRESSVSDFWIGGSDLSGNWTWTDGTKFDFTEWNPSQNLTGENCAAESIADGKWNAVDCFKTKPYVCSISSIPPPPTNPPFVDCGPLWFYFEPTGHCYGGIDGHATSNWNNAEKQCENIGGHLASIHSYIEFEFVQSMVNVDWKWFWIGLFSVDNEKTWKWSDGTPVNYTIWQPGKPSLGKSSCAVADNGFIDSDCSALYQGMCKRKP